MTKAMLITPDNETKAVDVDSFRDINEYLECRVFTVVPNTAGYSFDLLGDDEGLNVAPEYRKLNAFASNYYGHGPIFGNVLAMGRVDSEGEATDLTEQELIGIETIISMAYRNVMPV